MSDPTSGYALWRLVLANSLMATVVLASTASAQGRHDEKPHGYNEKVATDQSRGTPPTKYITLPSGPRGHDNPLAGKKIAVRPKPEQLAPARPATK